MTLVFHRNTRRRLKMIRPFFERLETTRPSSSEDGPLLCMEP